LTLLSYIEITEWDIMRLRNIYKHPKLILFVLGIVTVFFAFNLRNAQFDNNNIRFIPENDESRVTARYIDDTFGSSSFVLVGLEQKNGTVFDPEFLKAIREYVRRVEAIDIVGEVNSIVTSDYITAEDDAIVVKKLLDEDFSGTNEEIAELKKRLLSWDFYMKSLISEDFAATQILVPLDVDSEDTGKQEMVEQYMRVREIAHEMFDARANVYVTGLPIISATISEAMSKDLIVLIPLVVIVVLAVLFFSFRRPAPVVLTLLTVAVATIWAMGAMPLFNVKLSILSTVLPVILIAVGSAYGIHILTHYLGEIKNKPVSNRTEHTELILDVLAHIKKPIFLAALTTLAGFISFCFTLVLPVREWGVFASFGVVASFVVALLLIPALLILRGPAPMRLIEFKSRNSGEGDVQEDNASILTRILLSITQKKRFVLGLTTIVVLISIYYASHLVIDNVFVEYFKPETGIARSDKFIREKFGGSKIVSVVMQAEDSQTLLQSEALTALDGLETYLNKNVAETGKVMGFTGLVKRINQVFNADQSPLGLYPNGVPNVGEDAAINDSFGFADSGEESFGFDDDFSFGFDDAGASGSGDSPASAAANLSYTGLSETYNAEELLKLFNRALTQADGINMNAAELVTSLNRLTNYEGASYYEIPSDPERYGMKNRKDLQRIVSNYLALLSGSIDSYANDPLEPTAVKTTVQLKTVGEIDTDRAVASMREYIQASFPENVSSVVGGSAMIESSLNRLVVDSQLSSVIISLIVVFIIVAIANHSAVAGIIGIIPLIISILINFAVMGCLGIKLNIGTSLVASLSIGIGIDYTIHFMETYKEAFRESTGQSDYLSKTFKTAGMAIIINALSVGAGFAVLMMSQFVILANLGLLIALTMLVSAFVSLTVIPVLLGIIKPKFIVR
jgi:predicted RND superfamily exporter protein